MMIDIQSTTLHHFLPALLNRLSLSDVTDAGRGAAEADTPLPLLVMIRMIMVMVMIFVMIMIILVMVIIKASKTAFQSPALILIQHVIHMSHHRIQWDVKMMVTDRAGEAVLLLVTLELRKVEHLTPGGRGQYSSKIFNRETLSQYCVILMGSMRKIERKIGFLSRKWPGKW